MTPDQRPFRFGVLGESIESRTQLIETARRAEAFGYWSLMLRDHFVRDPFGPQFAPMVALMSAAEVTKKLRVGTLVLANDFRHPVILAKEVATLDLLSGGRFELGVGAGWLRDEYDRAGIRFDPPVTRVDRFEEALLILKGFLQGAKVTFKGNHYSVDGLATYPRPIQRPHPPIIVGSGSKRMLALAGRQADVVNILPKALPNGSISSELHERSPDAIRQKIEWVQFAANGRFSSQDLSMLPTIILSDDRRTAAEYVAQTQGWGISAADKVLEMPSMFIGSVDAVIEQMETRRNLYGFSHYVISDTVLEAFAPVVNTLREPEPGQIGVHSAHDPCDPSSEGSGDSSRQQLTPERISPAGLRSL